MPEQRARCKQIRWSRKPRFFVIAPDSFEQILGQGRLWRAEIREGGVGVESAALLAAARCGASQGLGNTPTLARGLCHALPPSARRETGGTFQINRQAWPPRSRV